MDRRLSRTALVLGAVGAGVMLLGAFQNSPESDKCFIEGHVLSSLTGEPVSQAGLILFPGPNFTSTDPKGRFVFQDLSAGSYRIEVSGAARGDDSESRGYPVSLGAGEQLRDLVIRMMPGGRLIGRVLDEAGDPMQGARVVAFRLSYRRGQREWESARNYTSDRSGEFRFSGLWAGDYLIAVEPRAVAADAKEGEAPANDSVPEMSYAPTFYPGTVDPGAAAPLQIRAGSETKLADLRMRRVSTVRVRGHVKTPYSRVSTSVRLVPAIPGVPLAGWLPPFTGKVDQYDGTFEIGGVPPGDYELLTQRPRWVPAIALRVSGKNLEGVELPSQLSTSLTGAVAVDDGRPMSWVTASLAFYPSLLPEQWTVPQPIDGEGKFRISLAPYRYRLAIEKLPEDLFYLKSLRVGNQELSGDWLDFSDGVPRTTLQITLRATGARIYGVTQSAKNEPAGGVIVVLVPDSKRPSLYRRARTGSGGDFTFHSLAPGEYSVVAVEDLEPDAQFAPDFLARYGNEAKRVSLAENDRRSVAVTAVPYQQ